MKFLSYCSDGDGLMNQCGMILLAKGVQFADIDDPMVVELLVLREAILWCMENGLYGDEVGRGCQSDH
ncbi:unnamed protein product [Linum trigynum]|uniref:Uncharacterized protein n=1 Tax=Linum trigynum TaxID=586398 RepID=A0AAV2GIC9_9ROSI